MMNKMIRIKHIIILLIALCLLSGCEKDESSDSNGNDNDVQVTSVAEMPAIVVENNYNPLSEKQVSELSDADGITNEDESVDSSEEIEAGEEVNGVDTDEENETSESIDELENAESDVDNIEEVNTQENQSVSVSGSGRLVCIDPGHQLKGNSEKEPIAPGSGETKAKVTGGTSGRFSGVPEYQVNLDVSLKLRDELIRRGYSVIMTRETNEVNMSNSERAMVANNAHADVFVRLHCNGSENSGANGIMTICPTKSNPYCSSVYSNSRRLSDTILDNMVACTGAKKEKVWETDTMSGINWSQVPVSIIEMGYMTNQTEDLNLVNADYQNKLVKGIADGIDAYFAQ